jgi:DNA-binding transcriptional LysR family regulator
MYSHGRSARLITDRRGGSPVLLAQLESFLEISRLGNMRRAANTLSISQPALTARLQALEEELTAQLFHRTHTGMALTPAGRAFLPHAERAIEAVRSGASLVRELEFGVVGELALAVAPAVSAYVLPEILVRFTERHPEVRLRVRTGHSEMILDLVARGEVELGIVRQLHDERFGSTPLYEDELVLIARPDHPFALAGRVDVSEIKHAQLILFDRTSSYYDLTNALFRAAGVVPRGVTEVDNIEGAKRMVERGLGVALLPGTAVADALAGGSVREVGLGGVATIRRQIVAVERQGARLASRFSETLWGLLEQIPELIPRALPVTTSE